MTDQSSAPAPEQSAAPADDGVSELSLEQARRLIDSQTADEPEQEQPAESAKEATAEKELSKDNSDQPEADPAEETEEAEPADDQPPIEPPRSWTKAEKERFQSLPRETQEYLHTREQEREREFRRSQNEAAEIRKAAEAERDNVVKARQEYEAKLPTLMQMLQDVNAAQFSDIKSMADVERMALEDPFRKIQWDTHQQKLQAIAYEKSQADQRNAQETQTKWQKLVSDENAKFVEAVPEFADKAKAKELTTKAIDKLTDLGFTQSELAELAEGKKQLPIYDHRIQQLLVDSLKLSEIKSAPKAVAAKPLPPVVRPGVSRGPNDGHNETIQALEKRLNQSGSEKDAWALYEAKLKAGSRRK